MAPQEETKTLVKTLKKLDEVKVSPEGENALLELANMTDEQKDNVAAIGLGVDPRRSIQITELAYDKLQGMIDAARDRSGENSSFSVDTSQVFHMLLEYDLNRNELIYAGSLAEEMIAKSKNPMAGLLSQILG